jgi:hypothetical protein
MPAGSKPGERRGGRARGTPNKKTLAIAAIRASGVDPFRFWCDVMANEENN